MIEEISIKGYKSFSEDSFEKGPLKLSPLNVLIGPNASGKTNFLEIFELLSSAADGHLQDFIINHGGISAILWAGGTNKFGVEIVYKIKEKIDPRPERSRKPLRYIVEVERRDIHSVVGLEKLEHSEPYPEFKDKGPFILADRRGTTFHFYHPIDHKLKTSEVPVQEGELAIWEMRDMERFPLQARFRDEIFQWKIYRYFHVDDTSLIRMPQKARSGLILHKHGDNLSPVLHDFFTKIEYSEQFKRIENILGRLYPKGFGALRISSAGGEGDLIINWVESYFKGRTFTAQSLSDGILRFLCLLAILLHPDPPSLLCIDEPEIGLHPSLMQLLTELLKDTSKRTQLIVATHSPDLVDYLEPEDVITVERDKKGCSVMTKLSTRSDLKVWLDKYRLGELWKMGELGARP